VNPLLAIVAFAREITRTFPSSNCVELKVWWDIAKEGL